MQQQELLAQVSLLKKENEELHAYRMDFDARLKQAEWEGASMVSHLQCMSNIVLIKVLQVYDQWCAQLTTEKSLAIKEGTHMADYHYETMRFLLSHEYPEGGGKPKTKVVQPLTVRKLHTYNRTSTI